MHYTLPSLYPTGSETCKSQTDILIYWYECFVLWMSLDNTQDSFCYLWVCVFSSLWWDWLGFMLGSSGSGELPTNMWVCPISLFSSSHSPSSSYMFRTACLPISFTAVYHVLSQRDYKLNCKTLPKNITLPFLYSEAMESFCLRPDMESTAKCIDACCSLVTCTLCSWYAASSSLLLWVSLTAITCTV